MCEPSPQRPFEKLDAKLEGDRSRTAHQAVKARLYISSEIDRNGSKIFIRNFHRRVALLCVKRWRNQRRSVRAIGIERRGPDDDCVCGAVALCERFIRVKICSLKV